MGSGLRQKPSHKAAPTAMGQRLLCLCLVFQDKFATSLFTVFVPDMQPNEPTVEAYDTACNQALFAFQIFKIKMSLKVACDGVSDQAHLVHVMTRVGFFSDAVAGFFKSLLHCAEVDSRSLHIKPPEVCESRQ